MSTPVTGAEAPAEGQAPAIGANPDVMAAIHEWLRPYQREILGDTSRYRVVLKSRQIGLSDLIALEMVLVAAGLHPEITAADCTIISKVFSDAKDVIKKCKKWIRILRHDPRLAPFLGDSAWSQLEIGFAHSGFRIMSVSQNPQAGRGLTGHLYLDEYAFYNYQREIWLAATPGVTSDEALRITIISTPNGEGDHFHETWVDHDAYAEWSRHEIDIHEASRQGHPIDIEATRKQYTADQFAQEFECAFLGGAGKYYPKDLLALARGNMPMNVPSVCYMGIDVASVVDHTAVAILYLQGRKIWISDVYLLPHMAYESDTARGRLGQADVIAALVKFYRPRQIVMDVTGDAAQKKLSGRYSLYDLLKARHPSFPLVGQTVSKEWKSVWCQKLKTSLQTSQCFFDRARVDKIFSNRFLDADANDYEPFVANAFEHSPWKILTSDFGSVYKKLLSNNETTFDTLRDKKGGHGDSYWAALFGFTAAISGIGKGQKQPSAADLTETVIKLPEYLDWM